MGWSRYERDGIDIKVCRTESNGLSSDEVSITTDNFRLCWSRYPYTKHRIRWDKHPDEVEVHTTGSDNFYIEALGDPWFIQSPPLPHSYGVIRELSHRADVDLELPVLLEVMAAEIRRVNEQVAARFGGEDY